jgi:hypothetical protein
MRQFLMQVLFFSCNFFFGLGWGAKQRVPNSTSLLSHMLWQMFFSFHLSSWAKGEELYTSK